MRGVIGPIGSGKSVGCCAEIMSRIVEQAPSPDGKRRSRWVVVRNTYRELEDTTVKTWMDWFGHSSFGRWQAQAMTHQLKFNDVEAEVMFRALDRPQDVKKLLSLELTGAWINEAREIPRSVIDMVQGRVGRYPNKREGGASWFGVILDTNPPDTDHWWYRLFEEARPEGWKVYHQPSGLSEDAENIDNLPAGYYSRLTAGKDVEWIKVFVHGEYGFVADGRPVWGDYSDTTHVAEITPDPACDLIVGIDFGLTPAAAFVQRDQRGRWLVVDELVTEDMGAVRFAEQLKEKLEAYRGFNLRLWGDPAGEGRSQVDERTPFQVLQAAGIQARPTYTNDPTVRIEAVSKAMRQLIDGKPAFLIDPRCRVLRKGLGGGYCYKRIQVSGDERYKDQPDKNQYSHVADALQYAFIGGGGSQEVIRPKGPAMTAPMSRPMSFKVFR